MRRDAGAGRARQHQPFNRAINGVIARHLGTTVAAIARQMQLDAPELRDLFERAGFRRAEIIATQITAWFR